MSFFTDIFKLMPTGGNLALNIAIKGDKMTLSIIPKFADAAGKAAAQLKPLIISGTPSDMDEGISGALESFRAPLTAFSTNILAVATEMDRIAEEQRAKLKAKGRNSTASGPTKQERMKAPADMAQAKALAEHPSPEDAGCRALFEKSSLDTLKEAYKLASRQNTRKVVSDEIKALTGKSAKDHGLDAPVQPNLLAMFADPFSGTEVEISPEGKSEEGENIDDDGFLKDPEAESESDTDCPL